MIQQQPVRRVVRAGEFAHGKGPIAGGGDIPPERVVDPGHRRVLRLADSGKVVIDQELPAGGYCQCIGEVVVLGVLRDFGVEIELVLISAHGQNHDFSGHGGKRGCFGCQRLERRVRAAGAVHPHRVGAAAHGEMPGHRRVDPIPNAGLLAKGLQGLGCGVKIVAVRVIEIPGSVVIPGSGGIERIGLGQVVVSGKRMKYPRNLKFAGGVRRIDPQEKNVPAVDGEDERVQENIGVEPDVRVDDPVVGEKSQRGQIRSLVNAQIGSSKRFGVLPLQRVNLDFHVAVQGRGKHIPQGVPGKEHVRFVGLGAGKQVVLQIIDAVRDGLPVRHRQTECALEQVVFGKLPQVELHLVVSRTGMGADQVTASPLHRHRREQRCRRQRIDIRPRPGRETRHRQGGRQGRLVGQSNESRMVHSPIIGR